MNDLLYPTGYPTPPSAMVSPWLRQQHPVSKALAADFLRDIERLPISEKPGLYGVLLARDGASLRIMRAAPPEVSDALGLPVLALPDQLPCLDGFTVARENAFPRGEPDALDVCPTSRLYAEAIGRGWTPLVSTELWNDGPDSDGLRHHGQCYPACRGRCRPLIRLMLGESRFAALEATCDVPGTDKPALISVYDDPHVVVVDKPAGLLSVPGLTEVADAQSLLQAEYGPRLMAAHRLDQATSGLIAFAKTPGALRFLQKMFAARRVEKTYEALLDGALQENEGEVTLPLRLNPLDRPRQCVDDAGKPAVTRWRVLATEEGRSRVQFHPETGRTHQLRVHAAHRAGLGIPIVGDELYGQAAARLCLHARDLTLPQLHDREPLHLHAAVPF